MEGNINRRNPLARTQYLWDITVFDLTTGEKVAQKTFTGTEPAKLLYSDGEYIRIYPNTGMTIHGSPVESSRGDKPVIADVNQWLLGIIK